MPTQINEVVRLSVRGRLHGSTVMYGHHFRAKTAGIALSALATAYAGSIIPLLVAATPAEVEWLEIAVSSTREGGDELFHHPLPAATIGTVPGETLPGQNSMLVSVHTGVRGKRQRGRFYVPGVSETTTTNGRIFGAQLDALNALAEGIQTNFTGNGNANFALTVYSPKSPDPKPPKVPKLKPDTIDTLVTNLIADSLVVTQRRRRLGVGA